MYLMAALPTYGNSKKHGGLHRRYGTGSGGDNLTNSTCGAGGGGAGECRSSCGAVVDFELLEIDENDNSFPWGLIHHNELAHMLNNGLGKTVVIDSRSFLEYNTSNIHQSVNVCCSKLVKRRLQQDKVHVLDLLNQTCNIVTDASWDVIVYDQCTEDPSQLTSDNFVQVLLHKLSTTFNSVAFLKGGFLAFQASHPSLTENKSSSHRCSTLTSLSQPCMPVSNIGPTRILPFLYLGSQQDSLNQDLAQVNGITYILNVSKTCPRPPYILDGHFHRIPVNDNYCEKLLPYFYEAFQFLDKVREANGCVLVHCLGGVSRSPTLAIAYIMRYMRMSSDEAYRYVKDKRPTISPNFNFLGQLLEYEKVIRKEEQVEEARKEAVRATMLEEGMTFDLERANPGVMDLHTTSPSSPGPRSAHRTFVLDQTSTQAFHSHLASSSFKLGKLQDCPLPGPFADRARPTDGSATASVQGSPAACPLLKYQPHNCTYPDVSALPGPSHQVTCSKSACFSAATTNALNISQFSNPLANSCDNHNEVKHYSIQSPVCPLTGFPSPGGAHDDFPQSTGATTGFPGPGTNGSSTSTVQPSFTAYHSQTIGSSSGDPECSAIKSSDSHPVSSEHKEQPKSRYGFSFSSVFSNFRWKSRPPTLPLGSPVGTQKEGRSFLKKQGAECGAVAQLTPVSEAVENNDLVVNEGLGECMKSGTPGCDTIEEMDTTVETSISDSGSKLSTATNLLASNQNILSTTAPESSSALRSASLRLSAKNFTLSLSSPTSEFPVNFPPSLTHKATSPSDSNKRKCGLVAASADSPDKVAKTEDHQGLTPPKTLNLGQGKLKQKLSARRPFVLAISSPTSAMAQLNFVSSPDTLPDSPSTAAKEEQLYIEENSRRTTENSHDITDPPARHKQCEHPMLEEMTLTLNKNTRQCRVKELPLSASLNTSSPSPGASPTFSEVSTGVNLESFKELPITSLDKLSFTPCYTRDIVQELKKQDAASLASEDLSQLRSSALDSPMSISSGSSAPSISSSIVSPVDYTATNLFPSEAKTESLTAFPFLPSETHLSADPVAHGAKLSSTQGTPDSVLSDLSPSFPQATIAPTLPTCTPHYYTSTSSIEPLSPMSLCESSCSSLPWSSKRNSISSPIQSSISSPISSLSSPIVSSPSFSPLVTSPTTSATYLASTSGVSKIIRREKSKRVTDRPNSIAFSSYPTCDLVPSAPDSSPSNPGGQASQDDASEAYMSVSGKRSRLSVNSESHAPQGRTSWGGYSEREVYKKYRQITAAMENAMLQTQVFSPGSSRLNPGSVSSRKARSLDDFLDNNLEETDMMQYPRGRHHWSGYRDEHLMEQYHCGIASEPYHSSSSLSSNGSRGSSMEIIQML
ncbi:mucin-2-like isoform X2 [Physella acuta]|uniref:mucin-2-like isoform X2 n=1 Tax=Physella acuta TaxID=109671 RepID=UPI0027DAC4DD|nr:mucin-2-like isoform X2 [Physella acuta]XP_059144305.1 mucin-2-like isoform X2 [Physella acuta]XP_059144306.1 mucin-2-like isoform X2 [Physella acuta]